MGAPPRGGHEKGNPSIRGTNKEVTRQGNLPYVLRWRRWRGAPEVVVVGIAPRSIRILPLHPLHEGDKKGKINYLNT